MLVRREVGVSPGMLAVGGRCGGQPVTGSTGEHTGGRPPCAEEHKGGSCQPAASGPLGRAAPVPPTGRPKHSPVGNVGEAGLLDSLARSARP